MQREQSSSKKEVTVALIITCYNRKALLEKCLESISNLSEKPNYLMIIDDCSDEFNLDEEIVYDDSKFPVDVITKTKRMGIKDSLIYGFDNCLNFDLMINLDGDSICKHNFITEIKRLKSLYPNHIVSGFNCDNPKNPVLIDNVDHVLRRHANGINFAIDKRQYETIVRPALLKEGNWDRNSSNALSFVISKPSLVQHLGSECSTMGHHFGDVACDF